MYKYMAKKDRFLTAIRAALILPDAVACVGTLRGENGTLFWFFPMFVPSLSWQNGDAV
jgi:hypothetical protein